MFANCSCICILSMPCMQAAPFCKSECYLIVPNGLHFSMNNLHGILTQGDLLSHSQVASQPTKPWKFDDLMILWVSVPKTGYLFGYLSKIIKNIGKTWEDYHILSVIYIQVLFSNPPSGKTRESPRLLRQLILQGEAGAGGLAGSIISNSWYTKVIFLCVDK